MTLHYYRSADGWRWRLTARNGRIVCASSEAFSSRAGAKRNARLTLTGLREALRDW